MRFEEQPPLAFYPIGHVRSPFTEKMAAPRQGTLAVGHLSQIELCDDPRLLHAVDGLEQWSHLWVIFCFDRDPRFSPKVQPPRSDRRRGVLATRSPHRPNPIGMTAARLVSCEGALLTLDGLDLLDGTPVLDLKPYVPYADCIAEASEGWLSAQTPRGGWELDWSELLREQLGFLEARQVTIIDDLQQILEAGPASHPSRRIRRNGSKGLLAFKDFRLSFRVEGTRLLLLRLDSGYAQAELDAAANARLELHRDYVQQFGQTDVTAWLASDVE